MTFKEYVDIRAAQQPIYWAGGVPWRIYKRMLCPLSHPHEEFNLQNGEVKALLRKAKVPLAMWTYGYGSSHSNWWWVIATTPYSLESLRPKARYNVRRGLKLCDVKPISAAHLSNIGYECYQSAMGRHAQTKPVNESKFRSGMAIYDENRAYTIWGVFKDSKLAGYALYKQIDNIAYEGDVILDPEFFKDHSTYALLHATTDHYLNQNKCSYIVCGWRSISHQTGFQDFTIKEFKRQKIYCHLGVEYSRFYAPLVRLNYHANRVLARLPFTPTFSEKLQTLYRLEGIRREEI